METMKTVIKETISLPKTSIERLMEAMRLFETSQDEIEDFLIVRNKTILSKIQKARKEHLKSEVKDFQMLAKNYV